MMNLGVNNMKKYIVLTIQIICFCFLTGMSLFRGGYYMSAFEGKVVDAETKEPIEGAAVLAVYYRSTISPAGSNHYAFDAQETLTGRDGQFKIPEKFVKSDEVKGTPRCNLIIFKPSYGVFPNHKLSRAVGEKYAAWPTPEKYIVYELPKLKTRIERNNNLIYSDPSDPNIPLIKIKNYIKLLNEERTYLGYTPYTEP